MFPPFDIDCVENAVWDDPEMHSPLLATMTRNERFVESIRRILYLHKKLLPKQGWNTESPEVQYIGR